MLLHRTGILYNVGALRTLEPVGKRPLQLGKGRNGGRREGEMGQFVLRPEESVTAPDSLYNPGPNLRGQRFVPLAEVGRDLVH